MGKGCGEGRRKGKTFSSLPLLYFRHVVLSPGFCFGLFLNSLSVSTSKRAGKHLCHCSHCKIHLVCRLCMRLVIIEERGRVAVGEACGQALQLWRAKRAASLCVSFRVTPPNKKLARRLEHALCNMPGRGCWLITEGLKKMYWT